MLEGNDFSEFLPVPSLILGLLLLSGGGVLFALSQTFATLLCSRALMGVGLQGADTSGALIFQSPFSIEFI